MFEPKENKELTDRAERFKRLADAFLSGLSESTRENYRADLKDFALFLNLSCLNETAVALVGNGPGHANDLTLQYKTHLRNKELGPRTINRRLAALKSLVKFSNTVGLINWKISIQGEKVERYKDTRGVSVPVLGEIISNSGTQENEAKAKRDVAILRLLSDLGLRRKEVVELDYPEHVDFSQNELMVLGKGRKERERMTMAHDTAKALKEWLEVRGDFTGPLFTSLSNRTDPHARVSLRGFTYIVSQSAKAVGVKSSPHKFRHTAITQAAIQIQEAGMPLEELLDFSRHKDIRTALIYRDQIENRQGKIATMVAEKITSAVKESDE